MKNELMLKVRSRLFEAFGDTQERCLHAYGIGDENGAAAALRTLEALAAEIRLCDGISASAQAALETVEDLHELLDLA